MKRTVTFDFDHTLVFEIGGTNPEGIKLFREHMAAGDMVHIVTSRRPVPQMVQEVDDFVKDNDLECQSVVFTNGEDKAETLVEMGCELHFDDCPVEIGLCEKAGIEAVRVFDLDKWNEFMDFINR